MRLISSLLAATIVGFGMATAKDDVPRGYEALTAVEQVKAEAVSKDRLVVVLVKGKNDDCPYCAAAVENGERALGSGVLKMFARAEDLNTKGSADFAGALKARVDQKFTTGAAVTFLVFNPDMSELLAEAGRKELESDKKLVGAFKKEVAEHKKALK